MKDANTDIENKKDKPFNKKMAAVNLVAFGGLFITWLILQLLK